MNLMADECIDLQIVNHLRKEGHDVVSVLELHPSISDDTVLQMSSQTNSLLLTSDKDFGELVFRHNSVSAGVILLRLAGLSQIKKSKIVSSVIRKYPDELLLSFTVITPGSVRIRKKI